MKQIPSQLLKELEELVYNTSGEAEITYYNYHKNRLKKTTETIYNIMPAGSRILDIGSLYLHQSILLKKLGYDVIAVDFPDTVNQSYIKERASKYGVNNNGVEDITKLDEYFKGTKFDMIIMCEVMEHLTFNPMAFGRMIISMLSDKGKLYLTTPNSMRLYNLLWMLKRIIMFQGIGLDVDEIFKQPTYFHHWKEYSPKEVRKYFSYFAQSGKLEINFYNYREKSPVSMRQPKAIITNSIRGLGNMLGYFSEELEIIYSK